MVFMMKLKKFLLPCITLFASICLSDEIDYSQFTSHQELIAFETAVIASFSDSELEIGQF
jgi:hypothetical protein